jgi:hypothetical protein
MILLLAAYKYVFLDPFLNIEILFTRKNSFIQGISGDPVGEQ